MTQPLAYYNEFDPYPAAWLRNLIDAGHIMPGRVDDRSIKEIQPNDLTGFTRVHMFAGIAGWDYALKLAGWPEEQEVWTGSCPCQPWSTSGHKRGADDPRHLWPVWFDLIRVCRPAVIVGEQVAGKDGLVWWDIVSADLEAADYACAAVDIPAAGVGAPHIRQRLYFVAYSDGWGWQARQRERRGEPGVFVQNRDMGDSTRADASRNEREAGREQQEQTGRSGVYRDLGNAAGERCREAGQHLSRSAQRSAGNVGDADQAGEPPPSAAAHGTWSDLEWIYCRDGKYRPTKPGLRVLANGVPGRLGKLRAYGNAIVPPLAAEFVRACMDVLGIDAATPRVRREGERR
jgi:DNA (cytosine-5)-methyltransferase 1